MTTEVEVAAQETQERQQRQRGPRKERKPKENTETAAQENEQTAEGDKPRQQNNKNRRRRGPKAAKKTEETPQAGNPEDAPAEPRRAQRVRAPLVFTPDADGFVEIRVSASRPRDIYASSIREAFTAGDVKKVLLSALGAGIPNAIFADDELCRTGVCENFAVEASTIEPEEQTVEGGRPAQRTPRVLINLTPSPSWDPQSSNTSPSN